MTKRGAFLGDTPLAHRIRELDLTLQEVADAAGLSMIAVLFLARGKGQFPSAPYHGGWTPNTLAKVSAALAIPPEVLAPELFSAPAVQRPTDPPANVHREV